MPATDIQILIEYNKLVDREWWARFLSFFTIPNAGVSLRYINDTFEHPVDLPFGDLEQYFDPVRTVKFMRDYHWVVYVIVAAYLLTIWKLQEAMETRPAFELRGPFFAWNAFLSLYSIWAVSRGTFALYTAVTHYGLEYSICITPLITQDSR